MEEITMKFRESYNVEADQLNDLFDTLKQTAQNFDIYMINGKLYLYNDGNFDALEEIGTPSEAHESPKPFKTKMSKFKEFFDNSEGYQVRKCGQSWDYCDGKCDQCEKNHAYCIATDHTIDYHLAATNHTTYNKPFSMISEDAYTNAYLESGDFGTRICNGIMVYCDQQCDKCKIDFTA